MWQIPLKVYNTCTKGYETVKLNPIQYIYYIESGWELQNNNRRFHNHQISFSEVDGSESIENFHEFVEKSMCKYEEQYLTILVRQALRILDKSESDLITAIFYEGNTEQEFARDAGISQQAVNKRKKKALAKLRTEILRIFHESGCYLPL